MSGCLLSKRCSIQVISSCCCRCLYSMASVPQYVDDITSTASCNAHRSLAGLPSGETTVEQEGTQQDEDVADQHRPHSRRASASQHVAIMHPNLVACCESSSKGLVTASLSLSPVVMPMFAAPLASYVPRYKWTAVTDTHGKQCDGRYCTLSSDETQLAWH